MCESIIKPKTVLAIHDMSGFGRCALTVVIPVLTGFGLQCVPVPTALLSTHTGGFSDFSFFDMTDFMIDTLRHYSELDMDFDCIYSGFLGNESQADITADYIKRFGKKDTLKVVDPAFADDGKLYSTIKPSMIDKMSGLISHADVITPNFTEAAFLLGRDPEKTVSREDSVKMAKDLSMMGADFTVITGVTDGTDRILTVGYNKKTDDSYVVENQRVNKSYPGCGDVFASYLVGSMLDGNSFFNSVEKADGFVTEALVLGEAQKENIRNGLPFETLLKKF